jgi:quercetin dioxygenase-like cupin family protein
MKKLKCMAFGIVVLSQISHLAYSAETSPSKITEVSRKIIQRLDVSGTDEELRLMLVDFPAEYSSVAHIHPVGGLCYVVQGAAESQYDGEEVKVFHAGDSYQDQANKKHLIFRNPSKTDVLKFTCTAKIKKDLPFMTPL